MKTYVYVLLFLACLLTTTLAGAEWRFGRSFYLEPRLGFAEFLEGFYFSLPFLAFLTAHEFGHFFAAKIKKIRVTPPLYLPFWLPIIASIGTFGAFIKIKDHIRNKKDYFDIGIAGPLAGFVVAIAVLIYGFNNLPSNQEFLYKIHPEYSQMGEKYKEYIEVNTDPTETVRLGNSIIYNFLEKTFADPSLLPHPYEESHYSWLLAGFLGLFFTALNLIPIGQLDGGHILFALIGPKAFSIVSPIIFTALVFYSGLGFFTLNELRLESGGMTTLYFGLYCFFIYLCFSKITKYRNTNILIALLVVLGQLLVNHLYPSLLGYSGFLAFGLLIGRVLGIQHPPTYDKEPLGLPRILLGWLAIGIFIVCFSLSPLL